MKLGELLASTGVDPGKLAPVEVRDVTEDSRKAGPGVLFVAVKGSSADGNAFIADALERGAEAAVTDDPSMAGPRVLPNPGGDGRRLLAILAARIYGYPWKRLVTVGVTGTNGKTSTARMLAWILESSGMKTGVMGTVGCIVGGREERASLTTPGAPETARLMMRMADAGDTHCVMEVSSHALSQYRVEEIRFDAAVFTNITRDHLDYHHDMEEYLRWKMHIFDLLKPGGTPVVGTYAGNIPEVPGAVTFGISGEDSYRIRDVRTSMDGVSFGLDYPGGTVPVRMKVPGRFNIYNAAGAVAAAASLGIEPSEAAAALENFKGVPGRFQPVDAGQDFLVVVDYAHTPDALERVLLQAKELTGGRVIAVFGAGGDRDSTKRPLMGGIASSIADVVIVTADNPRTEDPDAIIADILEGMGGDAKAELVVEPDRRAAITKAVETARTGDVVVIAGKGHEDYQILGTGKIHFDDREEALAALGRVVGR